MYTGWSMLFMRRWVDLPSSPLSSDVRRSHRYMKRSADVIASVLGLVLLSPAMLLIAVAIRATSMGPALFIQPRLGLGGRTFRMYKFRTMAQGAPDLRHADGTTVTSDHDPRVTRVGRLLRRTSLDELPQLLNVLRGDMSLVGPRPELPDGLPRYRPDHLQRLDVRPGITGWAAVHGRNDLPLHQRRELDVWYVRHLSVCLDIRILFLTLAIVFRGTGVNRDSPPAAQGEDGQ